MTNLRTITVVLLLALAAGARAGDGLVQRGEVPEQKNARVAFDQRLGDKVPLDATFLDENGTVVTLAQCINGKPTILILAYYRCPMLCGEVFAGTLDAMQQIRTLTCGVDYNVVCVSFDPKEQTGLALAKKRRFVTEYGRKEADQGWKFLTGKKDNIDRLTTAVGFHYEWDPMLKEYNHPSGITILSPEGIITRYFAGIEFMDRNYDGQIVQSDPARTLKMSLIEAGEGKIGSFTDKVFLSCYQYNPHTGKYSANAMLIMRLGGLLTLLIIAGVYARVSWKLPGGRLLVIGLLSYIALIPVIMFTSFSVDELPKWAWRGAVIPLGIILFFVGRWVWRTATKPLAASRYAASGIEVET